MHVQTLFTVFIYTFFHCPYSAVLESYVTPEANPGFITEENTVQNINLIRIIKNTKPPTMMESISALSLLSPCITRIPYGFNFLTVFSVLEQPICSQDGLLSIYSMPSIDVYLFFFLSYIYIKQLQVSSSVLPKVLPVSLKQVTICEIPELYDTGK
jgi:hypothetical protein